MNKLNDVVFSNIYNKLDLHGETKDIARVMINDFIDDNIKMQNEIVVIVHGIGKGILKEATQNVLASNKNVLYFKQDNYNEGQTLVQLRSDNMNKKGFTLTEILAVVVILGMIMLVVAPNLISGVQNRKPQVSEAQTQMIEEAANLYADTQFDENTPENTTICINIQELVNKGYLNNLNDASNEFINFRNTNVVIKNSSPRDITITSNQCRP